MQRSSSQSDAPAPLWHVTRDDENATTFVSVVWAIDGPRFAAVAATEDDCLAQICRYVAEQAPWQLWPPSAGRVATLLAAGDQAAAVREYFNHVGERWDAEWLTTARLGVGPTSGAWSGGLPLSVSSPPTAEGAGTNLSAPDKRRPDECRRAWQRSPAEYLDHREG